MLWETTKVISGLTSVSALTLTDTVATLFGGNLTGVGIVSSGDALNITAVEALLIQSTNSTVTLMSEDVMTLTVGNDFISTAESFSLTSTDGIALIDNVGVTGDVTISGELKVDGFLIGITTDRDLIQLSNGNVMVNAAFAATSTLFGSFVRESTVDNGVRVALIANHYDTVNEPLAPGFGTSLAFRAGGAGEGGILALTVTGRIDSSITSTIGGGPAGITLGKMEFKVNSNSVVPMYLTEDGTFMGDGTNETQVSATGLLTLTNGQEQRFNITGNANYVGLKAGATADDTTYALPIAKAVANNDIMVSSTAGVMAWKTPTSHTQISFSMYDAEPARSSETSLDGAFILLTPGTLASPTATQLGPATPANDISVSKGTGKIVVVVVAGSDVAGDITVTGTSVNRDTGATTGSDTDTITVDAVTTDGTDTDSNGNVRHAFTGAYITSKWFTGTVVLSTSTLNCTVYVYHVSFEQFDDTASITLDTFDANILTTSVNAEFDAYLYAIMVTGDKCNISREASLNVGADGETALVDRYWRLRRGSIGKAIDGTTDGTWVDVHYANSPAFVEDVSIKVWATEIVPLTLD